MPIDPLKDYDFARKMVQLFGLPERTVGFELRCFVGEIVTITCEYYPDTSSKETITERFRLERIEDGGE